ncbi:MATH and LRR domain-containing protein PFE0570w [Bicyclus anynana]|uniref:MATH and LRR domain-containing protein PFE0570w n=1 Tax=Bicyclus anynana TaxID=110368 RepID=A0A6J1NTM6_BICAN|nr:MATH and LRR domain-containing protein PFE0570w [Bicyclus anynana]
MDNDCKNKITAEAVNNNDNTAHSEMEKEISLENKNDGDFVESEAKETVQKDDYKIISGKNDDDLSLKDEIIDAKEVHDEEDVEKDLSTLHKIDDTKLDLIKVIKETTKEKLATHENEELTNDKLNNVNESVNEIPVDVDKKVMTEDKEAAGDSITDNTVSEENKQQKIL